MTEETNISILPEPEAASEYHEKPFAETVSSGFKVFALFAIGWFLIVFLILKGLHLLDETAGLTLSGKIVLALVAGTPLVLALLVILRFYWWLSLYMAHFSIWGRALNWAKYFWFVALIASTYAYIDPLDNVGRSIARALPIDQLAVYGIPPFNPALVLFRLVVLLLILLFCFSYIKLAAEIAWNWMKEAWEMAVSFPQGLVISATNFLRPNICVEYPEYRDELPENFRGRHLLASDDSGKHLCIACRACERACPDRLILISAVRNPETKKLELTGFLLDNSRCCFCGLCEDSCPTYAVRHTTDFEYSCYDRSDLVLDLFGEYIVRTAEARGKLGGANVS